MKLRIIIPLLLVLTLGPACAPKKVVVEKAPEKPIAEAAVSSERLARAETLYSEAAYAQAAAAYLEFAAAFPGHARSAEALMQAGSAYFQMGEYASAREAYQRVAADYPGTASAEAAQVESVLTYFYQGQFEELLLQAGKMLKTSMSVPQELKLFAILGDAYLALDSPVDAAYAYARAYEIARAETGDELYAKLQSALRLMERSQVDVLTERLESPELRQLVAELADALIYKRFTIGCLLPLSGRYEAYGRRAINGIQLAFNQAAAALANPHLEIIVKDTRSDPMTALRALGELYKSGVAAVIGPIASAEQAARVAQERHLPIITFTQKEHIADIGDFVFRNFFTPGMQVQAIVAHAVKDFGARRFAILYPDEKYGATFMNLFWDEVIHNGGQVVAAEPYDIKTTDFAEPIKKLVGLHYAIPADIRAGAERVWPPFNNRGSAACDGLEKIPGLMYPLPEELACWKGAARGAVPECIPEADREAQAPAEPDAIVDFDAIFIPDAPDKVGLILPQLAFYDVNEVTLMGTNLWSSETLIKMSRGYIQGAVLPDGFFVDSVRPDTRKFVEMYQAAFEEPPGYIEAIGYDTARLLLGLVNRPDVRSRNELRDELLRVADFKGATGETAFDYNGEVHKPLFLLEVRGGRFVETAVRAGELKEPLPASPVED